MLMYEQSSIGDASRLKVSLEGAPKPKRMACFFDDNNRQIDFMLVYKRSLEMHIG